MPVPEENPALTLRHRIDLRSLRGRTGTGPSPPLSRPPQGREGRCRRRFPASGDSFPPPPPSRHPRFPPEYSTRGLTRRSASDSRNRPWCFLKSRWTAPIFAALFTPKPGNPETRSFSRASSNSSTEVIPNSFQRRFAFFGPTPSSLIRSVRLRGTSSQSFSSTLSSPHSTSSLMWLAISLPIPGSVVRSSPASTMAARERVRSPTVRTAFR